MVRTGLICSLIVSIRSNADSSAGEQLSTSQAWGFSMLAGVCLIIVGIIAGEVLMCIKTCISVNTFRLLLNLLYALACGTMVGDVILHALPQAFTSN
jgi:zinc transporter ZupT